jgi:FKBP-type peptidyl-prolyl cis-trans isomerase FklB
MKFIVTTFLIILNMSLAAQSKKDLLTQVDQLKAELAELKKPKVIDMTDKHQQASYALGILLAENLRTQGADSLSPDAISAGFKDLLLDKPLQINRQECLAVARPYMQAAMENRNKKLIEEGVAFLEANKKKEGVKVTPTGLQYKVLQAGTGNSPNPEDSVMVSFTGKLIDGTVFDKSESDHPVTFVVSQSIPGWTEALSLMHEGDRWEVFLPYPLAYGERGAMPDIPPFATLIFEIELLKVN